MILKTAREIANVNVIIYKKDICIIIDLEF